MRKIITGILIIMLSAATSQAVYAKAVGKFVKVEGRVDITRPGEPAELVSVGMEIFEKDIIRSKSNSKAEILFRDGNVLRLAQKTRVEVSEYISDSNRRSTILNLFRGKIQNKVKKLFGSLFGDDKNRYEVHTPTSVCGVRGTDFFMSYQKGVSGATFKEGFGYGYNKNQPDNIIEVKAGQSMVIPGSNGSPMLRPASPAEINRLEEETTPADEGEILDEEDSPDEIDNSSGDVEEDAGDNESAAEEGDTGDGESEAVVEETSDAGDEGPTNGDEAEAADSDTEQNDSDSDSADTGGSAEDVAMEESSETGGASTTDDSEFISIDTGSSEGDTDDGEVDGFAADDTLMDATPADNLSENTSQADTAASTAESSDTTTDVNNETQVDIPQEVASDTGTEVSTDTTTDPTPEPIMNVSGKLMDLVSGTHIEGEYVLPRATDPNRTGYVGKIEAAMYRYDYFQADDGTILRASSEQEISDPDTWTMYNYLPGGTLVIEAGGEGDFTPQITESTWVQSDLQGIADPPGTDYFLRYSSEFATTIITGVGVFAGDIMGISSELWSATESIPADITFSGQYTSTGDPVSLFKSPLSGSFTDGGAYSGFFSGDEANAVGSINALYINPDGTELGILKGDFSGEVNTEGDWNGAMYPIVMSTDTGSVTGDSFLTNIDSSGYLEIERLTGDFSGSNDVSIKAHGIGNTSYIVGQDWGIFDLMFAYAKYDESAVSSSWSGSVIGFGEFGENDGGMWVADITSGGWDANGITGDLNGTFLTMTKTGTIEGSLVGVTDSAGAWAAVSQGSWQTTNDLQFASSLDGSLYLIRAEEGGSYWNSNNESTYSYNYNLYSHEGGFHFYNSANGTDTYMQINAWDFDGTVADFYRQDWVYDHDSYAFIDYSSVSAANFLLQSLRTDPTTYTGITWDYNEEWTSYNMYNTGWFEGILGGLDSPWDGSSSITLLGFYEAPFYVTSGQSVIFAIDIESQNPDSGTATTFDGGAYSGFMGGILASSTTGNISAIYIDPDNNAGVLFGDFQGSADGLSGIWEADGGVYPVQLYSGIGVTPVSLVNGLMDTEYHSWDSNSAYYYQGEDGGFFDDAGSAIGYFEIGGGHFFSKYLDGEPWGVWQNVVGGAYSGTTGNDWSINLSVEIWDDTGNVSGMIATYGVSDGIWSGSKIDADVLGAWVDLEDVVVGVSSGTLEGTYDPTDLTWQTVGSGVWVQAGQFLDMTATAEGRATLAELNIPAIEIGRTTLNGTGSTVSVTMTDVTFFAPSTGGNPRIWATDNISGTYSVTPYVGDYVYMSNSDSTVTADFTIRKWDGNNWAADISNGTGTLNRTDVTGTANVAFSGVAGGTYTGTTSGSFSGEGAGVVR